VSRNYGSQPQLVPPWLTSATPPCVADTRSQADPLSPSLRRGQSRHGRGTRSKTKCAFAPPKRHSDPACRPFCRVTHGRFTYMTIRSSRALEPVRVFAADESCASSYFYALHEQKPLEKRMERPRRTQRPGCDQRAPKCDLVTTSGACSFQGLARTEFPADAGPILSLCFRTCFFGCRGNDLRMVR